MLKENELYFGDCLELMHGVADKSINLIKADLPFGTTKCSWDSVIDLPRLWKHYERIIKDNGAILLNAQTPFDKVLGASNLKLLRYEWIWEKTSATGHFNAKKMPMKAHENILVFYKNLPTYNPQKTSGHIRKTAFRKQSLNSEVYNDNTASTFYDSTDRYPRSVLLFSSDKQNLNLHPTQKPLALEEYLIKTYTNVGDLVLDNCMGSGTTIEACILNNRNWIGMEKSPIEFEKAKQRISKYLTP